MSTRAHISILVFSMVQAVLFFTGTIITLLVTDQSGGRALGIVATIVVSALIGTPLSFYLAPRLRARYVREHVPPIREEGL